MLPRKTGKPIAFKCTEELRQQTEAIADSLGESLSDYVRKAVEMRNRQMELPKLDTVNKEIGLGIGIEHEPEPIKTDKQNNLKIEKHKYNDEFRTFFKNKL